MGLSIRIQAGHDDGVQSLCILVVQQDGRALFACPLLMLAWRGNENQVSSIPPGEYRVVHRTSEKLGRHLWIQDVDGSQVDGRAWIAIHGGNRHDQIEGCFLPGLGFGDAGGDGRLDVVNSRAALREILALVPTGGCPLYLHASAENDAEGYDLRADKPVTNR